MIVDEHLAALGEAGEREHTPDVPSGRHARRLQDSLLVHGAHEADLATLGESDRAIDRKGSFR
jgi:hypothetical protein